MAGKVFMFSQSIFLVVTLASFLGNGVHCNSVQNRIPLLCEAENDSSEECNQELGQSVNPSPASGLLPSSDFIVKYSLYTNRKQSQTITSENYEREAENLNALPGAPWKVLIHGFLNSGSTTFPVNVRDAYIRNMEKNPNATYNVLVVDWGDGACASVTNIYKPYRNAAEKVEQAGHKLGDLLSKLHSLNMLNVTTDVHLIGHSLGSHVAGQAARRIYQNLNTLLWRISGLDPAGPLFWRNILFIGPIKPYPRLRRNRVRYLDVYHTSTMFGGEEDIGDVDFYINGGEHQPSCEVDFFGINVTPNLNTVKMLLQVCSHNYATVIFAQSVNDDSMKGCTGCYSYSEYEKGECDCEDDPVLGEHVVDETIHGFPSASGIAYIKTKRDTSVGSNYLQMLKDNKIFGLLGKGLEAVCL